MKKPLIALLIFCILLFAVGCANSVDTLDKNIAKESSPEAVKSSESSGSITNTDKVWKWPTEKWSISTPEDQGMDSNILSGADKRINENYPNVYSLLIVRHGYLVYEKYRQGLSKDSYKPVYSVTKSVISALTGIALREKLISSIDQKISDFFPEYFTEVDDIKKREITIRNILTMSAGLETIDSNYEGYYSSGDWCAYTIKKPLTDNPGEKFVYNTGLPHFLSGLITKTSKISTLDFANKFLFSQIGISIEKQVSQKRWDKDQVGYYGGGSGLYLTPVDMAKFGYLYLKNGLWDGKQIIPEEWVRESTKKQITVSPGGDTGDFGDYGYLFWIKNIKDKVHKKDYLTYYALGSGEQKIVIIPDLDMVIIITANLGLTSEDKANTQDIISDYILPAVK